MIWELDETRIARIWKYFSIIRVIFTVLAFPADFQNIPKNFHWLVIWIRAGEASFFLLGFIFFTFTKNRKVFQYYHAVVIVLLFVVTLSMTLMEYLGGTPENLYFFGIIMALIVLLGYGYLSYITITISAFLCFLIYFLVLFERYHNTKIYINLIFIAAFLNIIFYFISRHLEFIRNERDQIVVEKNALIAELTESQRNLTQANEAKTRFLANITHDLRNPITIIKMGIYLLAQSSEKEDTRIKYIRDIQNSAVDLESMVNDLIDTAFTEINLVRLSREQKILMDPLLDEVLSSLLLKYPAAILKASYPNPNKIEVVGDDITIKRILYNLLDNSIKHSTDGVVNITLNIDLQSYILSIKNLAGTFIPSDGRIFTPFERLNADASVPGIGLGLGIAKALIQKIHGEIEYSFNEVTSQIEFKVMFCI